MTNVVAHHQLMISMAKQGRSAYKGARVTDDAPCSLFEIYAVTAAKYEPRMAHQRESTSTDARY